MNPAEEGWQIVNRKVTGSSKLALNTATKEQAKALAEHPKLKEVGLRAEVVGRRRQRMVIYDIPIDRMTKSSKPSLPKTLGKKLRGTLLRVS